MARKPEAEKENSERWLLTYSDMITLLMLFFVVLYSMSNVDSEKYKALAQAMENVFTGGNWGIFDMRSNSQTRGLDTNSGKASSGSHDPYENKKQMTRLKGKVTELFKPEIRAKYLNATVDERGLVITLTGDIYFDGGSAILHEEAMPVLKKISTILNGIPNFVRVEGYSDNSAIAPSAKGESYATNWDLAAARSINVLRYLSEEEKVEPRKLSATSYGEYRPIEDNSVPEGRAYNRRVDIVILNERPVPKQDNPDIPRPLPDEEWR